MTHGMKSKKTVTVMGYPGLTLFRQWLKEDIPKENQIMRCKSFGHVVKHTQEQKIEAVELYCAGHSPKEISERMGIRAESIGVWKKQLLGEEYSKRMKEQKTQYPSSKKKQSSEKTTSELERSVSNLELELKQLQEEVLRLRIERDVLEEAEKLLKKGRALI